MKPLRLIIAAAILVLLGGAWWYSEKYPPKSQTETETDTKQPVKMVTVKDEQIERVKITHPENNATLEVAKDARGNWSITQPKPMAADGGNVKSLVSAISGLQADQVVEEKDVDWKGYGFDPPKLSV